MSEAFILDMSTMMEAGVPDCSPRTYPFLAPLLAGREASHVALWSAQTGRPKSASNAPRVRIHRRSTT